MEENFETTNVSKKNDKIMLNDMRLPFSDTTVSLVRARIWSRLKISGVGKGKKTLLSSTSRGVAMAWNQLHIIRSQL